MGPIQSSVNTTLGMMAGLKKLGNIGKGVDEIKEQLSEQDKEFLERATKEYGLSEQDANMQLNKFKELAKKAEPFIKQEVAKLQSFSAEKSETALQNVSEQQETRIQQQKQAQAYREAIRQREEERRTTTYSFNPDTKQLVAQSNMDF